MATPPPVPRETILVVDDDPEVLAVAADLLGVAGYTVLSTGDPCEALQLARTRFEPIHLLLTDVLMPFMSGSKLAEEFRSIRPEVKVLFMSGYWESLEDYRIRLAPGEPFLDKPFTITKLKAAVREAHHAQPFAVTSALAAPPMRCRPAGLPLHAAPRDQPSGCVSWTRDGRRGPTGAGVLEANTEGARRSSRARHEYQRTARGAAIVPH